MARRGYASPACLLGEGVVEDPARPVRLCIKRIYEAPARGDGFRVLVDRLWPRGVTKEAAQLSAWAKELAPSTQLRRWFGHAPRRWAEFERRYREELKSYPVELQALRHQARRRRVTLLYAARNPQVNHALILKAVLEAN
ncbi:MAG TPA: DUF488 family protein [Steroidobacteraceae bacterium]